MSSSTLLQEDMLEADKASLALQSGRSEEEDKPLGLRDAAAATRAQQLVASSWFSALPLSSSLQDSSLQEDMWEEEDRPLELRGAAAATRAQQLVAWFSELSSSLQDSSLQEDMWEEEDRLRAAATRAQQLVASELPLSSPDSGMSA